MKPLAQPSPIMGNLNTEPKITSESKGKIIENIESDVIKNKPVGKFPQREIEKVIKIMRKKSNRHFIRRFSVEAIQIAKDAD